MRPTAMQKAQCKERDKVKSSTPPIPPPKHTTTINVVSNGVRSQSSSSSSSLTDLGLNDSQDSTSAVKASSGVFISSVTARDVRRKEPPPVMPREKQNSLTSMKPSPVSSVMSSPAASLKSSPATSLKSSPSASMKSSPSASVMSSPSSSVRSSPTPSLKFSPRPLVSCPTEADENTSMPKIVSGLSAHAAPSPPPKPQTPVLDHISSGNMNRSTIVVDKEDYSKQNVPSSNSAESDFFSSLPPLPADDHVASVLTSLPNMSSPTESPQESGARNSYTESSSTAQYSSQYYTPAPPIPPPPPIRKLPPPLPKKPVPPAEFKPFRHQEESTKTVTKDILENSNLHEDDPDLNKNMNGDGNGYERFYVSMGTTSEVKGGGGEGTFAGRRDVRKPQSLQEKSIVSAKGSVRGFKNRVRAGIVTFVNPDSSLKQTNYREVEKGQVVLYTTSVSVVRETAARCQKARNILMFHMVRFDQRDLCMNPEHQVKLRQRLSQGSDVSELPLPQIFVDGIHLGGLTELERVNESGELRRILHSFPKVQVRSMCDTCGGYRFVPCVVCHGSKRSVHRNNFTEEFFALRCMHCDDGGLQRCQNCTDQQE